MTGGQTCALPIFIDITDHTRTYRLATLSDRKPQLLLHRNRCDQVHRDRHIVTRHHHLRPLRQRHHTRHIRRPKVKLWPIPIEKRGVPTPLFLRQHIHLRFELQVRCDRSRLRQHLTPLDLIALHTPKQHPDVVPRLTLIQQLPKHLHSRRHRLRRRLHPHDLHFLTHFHNPPVHPTRRHRPATLDRKHILHRHQKRTVHRSLRRRHITVHRLHQLKDALRLRRIRIPTLQRLQGTALHHRNVISRKIVLREQLPDFQLHQLQQLRIIHHVHFVHEHHDVRHPHLTCQQNVFAGLRHRSIGRTHHQNRPIHLGRTGDHVLDIVGMPWAVHVGVVARIAFVLHMRGGNGDAPGFFLRRLIDFIERHFLGQAFFR